jgi:hypothetical protein
MSNITGPAPQSRWSRILRRVVRIVSLILVNLAVFAVGIKVVDTQLEHLVHFDPQPLTMGTLDAYPFTGMHMQADFVAPNRVTGRMGFWDELDVLNPPAKRSDEFRIVLIGGSGAQGQGAFSMSNMLYRQLERFLDFRYKDDGLDFRVINMAMGGTVTYQNWIALNLWAHPLEPDLVLSYSGFNEWHVALKWEGIPETYMGYRNVGGSVLSRRADYWPDKFALLSRLLPHTTRIPKVRTVLKAIFLSDEELAQAANALMRERLGLRYSSEKEMLWKFLVPRYVDSLKSIKRDFDGIPVVVARQVVAENEFRPPVQPVDARAVFGEHFYDEMYARIQRELRSYVNTDWRFPDCHARAQTFGSLEREDFGIHLTDRGQIVMAFYMAEELAPLIEKRRRLAGKGRHERGSSPEMEEIVSRLEKLEGTIREYRSKNGGFPKSEWIDLRSIGEGPADLFDAARHLGADDGNKYLYRSDGGEFKVICLLRDASLLACWNYDKRMVDPRRPGTAIGYWTHGARRW